MPEQIKTGWIVVEQCRIRSAKGGEILERYPRSRHFATREAAEESLKSLTPEHGGVLVTLPRSAFQKPPRRKLKRDYRRK